MKPFDIEKAKAGAKVCTRNGLEAEILKFDLKGEKPLVVVIKFPTMENVFTVNENGRFYGESEYDLDLCLAPVRREGWVNLYEREDLPMGRGTGVTLFPTLRDAQMNTNNSKILIKTIKITWEE